MSQILFVFSTLASDVAYTNHTPGGGDMPIAQDPVVIKGGAGVANDRLVTPRGVMTRVTAEQVEYLRQNEVFKMHEANGFITISEGAAEADVVAADMTGRDESAPVVPQDNVAGDGTATVVGGEVVQEAAVAPKTSKKK